MDDLNFYNSVIFVKLELHLRITDYKLTWTEFFLNCHRTSISEIGDLQKVFVHHCIHYGIYILIN